MLNIVDCKLQIDTLIKVKKINYNKGDYDGLRQSLQLNWQELLLPLQNDIDAMWLAFKQELQNRIMQLFIPKMNNCIILFCSSCYAIIYT